MKDSNRLVLAIVLATGSAPLWASTSGEYITPAPIQSETPPCRYIVGDYFSGNYRSEISGIYLRQLVEEAPQCFPNAPETARTSINSTSFVQALAISNALQQARSAAGPRVGAGASSLKGMAAGDAAGKWNAWGTFNHSDTEQSTKNTDYGITTGVGGFDYGITPTMAVGLSVSVDDGRIAVAGANSDSNGYIFAPYIGVQLSPEWSVDASIGLGRGEFKNGGQSADADRWYGAVNLTYDRWFDDVQITSKGSYLHGVEDYDKGLGIAGSNTIDQLRLGVQAGVWRNGVMPYVSATFSSDVARDSDLAVPNPAGRNALLLGVGANFYSLANGVTGGISGTYEVGRKNQDNYALMANLNVRF